MSEKILFTSESVSEGHPDKLCDAISDAILDACLAQDPNSRVACECFATTNLVVIGGEITTTAKVDYEAVARNTILEIGYNNDELGIDGNNCVIQVVLDSQSPDIALGTNDTIGGAGDQGIMFGYASSETKNYMPLAISMAHDLVKYATKLRKEGKFKWARPDMKSQVTIDYSHPEALRVDTILMSVQHDGDVDEAAFKAFIKKDIMDVICEKYGMNHDYICLINPTGRFVIGGPHGDTGLTGRKIIVDTYGGYGRHGGGAFSGKDPSKVDRSAAYMARYIAKNMVAAGLCQEAEIQLSYAIGCVDPQSVYIDTKNTGVLPTEKLVAIIKKEFNLTPKGIIESLNLRTPIYRQTAAYGHFGQEGLPWEALDKVDALKKYVA